jgi:hypothetical protein
MDEGGQQGRALVQERQHELTVALARRLGISLGKR